MKIVDNSKLYFTNIVATTTTMKMVRDPWQFALHIASYIETHHGQEISPKDFAQSIFKAIIESREVIDISEVAEIFPDLLVFCTTNSVKREKDESERYFSLLISSSL